MSAVEARDGDTLRAQQLADNAAARDASVEQNGEIFDAFSNKLERLTEFLRDPQDYIRRIASGEIAPVSALGQRLHQLLEGAAEITQVNMGGVGDARDTNGAARTTDAPALDNSVSVPATTTAATPDTPAQTQQTWQQRIITNNDAITDNLDNLATVRPGGTASEADVRALEQATIANFTILGEQSSRATEAASHITVNGVIDNTEVRIYQEIIRRSGVDVASLGISGVRNISDINEAHELGAALNAANERFKEREEGVGR